MGTEQRELRYQTPHPREHSAHDNRPPPVPPASRSPKGPGDQAEPPTASDREAGRTVHANLKEQDRQGDIKQNTTHQGHQQDR